MGDAISLLAQMRAKREFWIDLEPGLRVKLRRPTEWEVSRDFPDGKRDPIDNVRDYTVGWDGFSEATLLGEAIGSSDPMPFSRDVWAEAISDRIDWIKVVMSGLVDAVNERSASRREDQKN